MCNPDVDLIPEVEKNGLSKATQRALCEFETLYACVQKDLQQTKKALREATVRQGFLERLKRGMLTQAEWTTFDSVLRAAHHVAKEMRKHTRGGLLRLVKS